MAYASDLTSEELARVGLHDTARAGRLLVGLAGQGVTDDVVAELLPSLLRALSVSPDPDRALANFARWTDAVANRYTHFQYLIRHPAALDIFLNVCGVSQFFSDILARDPEYFEILANPGVRGGAKPADRIYRELAALVDCIMQRDLKLEAMRKYRRREVLRIGTRDILGLADMPTTAREFSNLADACVQKCLALALDRYAERASPVAVPGFAVVALGKLGGAELNYSSDIDLVFVCADADDDGVRAATSVAEWLVGFLSRDMQNGHLFRVDLRLRPEGRFGALVRTLAAYESYYENWAETWERQALLKARPVAGDARIGERFMEVIAQHAYPRHFTSALLGDIRENKRRIERKAAHEGVSETNVKTGRGGIRDIEFAVQLLQMEHAGRETLLRSPNTLEAVALLRQARLLSASDAADLSEAYAFLRTVEHRLQLLYDRQTQVLPSSPHEMRLLARRLGFRDTRHFQEEHQRHTGAVVRICRRLFWSDADEEGASSDEFIDALANPDAGSSAAILGASLREYGFFDPDRATALLRAAVLGSDFGGEAPEAGAAFVRLSRPLLEECARTGDPDGALFGVDALSQAYPNRAEWYDALRSSPDLLRRIVRLAAGSRTLSHALAKHPEWLDMLMGDEIADFEPKARETTEAELRMRLQRRSIKASTDGSAFWDELALYVHRERLRIGARDLWGQTRASSVGRELSWLADCVLDAMLRHCVEQSSAARAIGTGDELPLALIGLGKLGGLETSYGSDFDVLFVCDESAFGAEAAAGRRSPAYAALQEVSEAVLSSAQRLRERNLPFGVDARLRPEGRYGPIVQSVEQYRAYYATSAAPWEHQTLIKARHVAGSPRLGAAFVDMVHQTIYGRPHGDEVVEEIRRMKRRIETERLRPHERDSDLKLGHGGLSDIEFTVQLGQLQHGGRVAAARATSTIAALHALGACGAVPEPDARRLSDAYGFLSALRNRMFLLTGQPIDVYPKDARRARALAVGLGIVGDAGNSAAATMQEMLARQMASTRRIVERLFYEPGGGVR